MTQTLTEKLIVFPGNYGNVIIMSGGAACLARDTEILMANGTKKKIQNIAINDMVMGADGSPKRVNNLYTGKEQMVKLETIKGDSYTSNRSHIHSFVCSVSKGGYEKGEVYNITYDEWLNLPDSAKEVLKVYKSDELDFGFEFTELGVDTYYGFSLDAEDRRYVLGNFLVTHNSGKGFSINNFIETHKFKIRDVDAWKTSFLKLAKLKNKYPEIQGLDLKKPDDVSKLHVFISDKKIKKNTMKWLLWNANKDRLPNIIFDVTGKDISDIVSLIPQLLEAGYDAKKINLIWVLTNYKVALKRNTERSRTVRDDVVLTTHEGAAKTFLNIMKGRYSDLREMLDGAIHVILGDEEHTIFFKDEDGKDIKKKKKELPANLYPKGKGMKDILTRNQTVVKDFTYFTLKNPGEDAISYEEFKDKLMGWIKEKVPETVFDS
jgi:hypothetical protein